MMRLPVLWARSSLHVLVTLQSLVDTLIYIPRYLSYFACKYTGVSRFGTFLAHILFHRSFPSSSPCFCFLLSVSLNLITEQRMKKG